MKLAVHREAWPLAQAFTISRGSKTVAQTVMAEIQDGAFRGRGEGVPYGRYGETVEGVLAAIEAMAGAVAEGLDRDRLQEAMPPGAARNALDAALWDLQAKREGKNIWRIAGIDPPRPLITAFTLSLGLPEAMAAEARVNAERPILKLKLGGDGDLDRVRAVRQAAPRPRLIVDANEGWTVEQLQAYPPELAALGVELIEQPLPAGKDEALQDIARPVPICADESCHSRQDLPGLAGRYDCINIKLDKTGGLTEALALLEAAKAQGFRIMVGCLVGSSLGLAPAVILAERADFVDLDAPLLLARDRQPGLRYDGSTVYPPKAPLWGASP